MTILVNLLGQPSSGKTSLAAKLFARLKSMGINVEYATEYVKGWAWEGRPVGKFGQFYIFGKETHNQSKLFNKVDIVIADSPVMLTAFYHSFLNHRNSLSEACKEFYNMSEEAGVTTLNFFLPRKKKYSSKGRFQTEEEATEVARQLKIWLANEEYEYEELTCSDEERLDVVMDRLEGVTHDFSGFDMD